MMLSPALIHMHDALRPGGFSTWLVCSCNALFPYINSCPPGPFISSVETHAPVPYAHHPRPWPLHVFLAAHVPMHQLVHLSRVLPTLHLWHVPQDPTIHPCVELLADQPVPNLLTYCVEVVTTDMRGAGTDSNVWLEIHGTQVRLAFLNHMCNRAVTNPFPPPNTNSPIDVVAPARSWLLPS